jgi:hypothetical protein
MQRLVQAGETPPAQEQWEAMKKQCEEQCGEQWKQSEIAARACARWCSRQGRQRRCVRAAVGQVGFVDGIARSLGAKRAD